MWPSLTYTVKSIHSRETQNYLSWVEADRNCSYDLILYLSKNKFMKASAFLNLKNLSPLKQKRDAREINGPQRNKEQIDYVKLYMKLIMSSLIPWKLCQYIRLYYHGRLLAFKAWFLLQKWLDNLKNLYIIFILCVWVCSLHVCRCTCVVQCLQRSGEGIRSPATGDSDNC